jgi:hypothetical protein
MRWRLLARGPERGIPDGEFNPESILVTGGGALTSTAAGAPGAAPAGFSPSQTGDGRA